MTALGVTGGFGLHRCYVHVRGIEVCLRNVDTQPLRAGVVRIKHTATAQAYPIGDLAPGAETCVWVKPDSDGVIDVMFTGSKKPFALNGYIEPGNSGWISGQVTAEGVRVLEKDLRYYF